MKQSDAVVMAVINVCGQRETYKDLTRDEKDKVYAILQGNFETGKIDLKQQWDSEQVRKYIPGLVNNHLRKDRRLNGNTKYEAKAPGSRAGVGDPTIKALKVLLDNTKDAVKRAGIHEAIMKRKQEVQPKGKELTVEQVEILKGMGLEHLIDS